MLQGSAKAQITRMLMPSSMIGRAFGNLPGALRRLRRCRIASPRFRHVVGELHAEKVVHVGTERLFDAQSHFRRQCGLVVEQVGERGAAHLEDSGRLSSEESSV